MTRTERTYYSVAAGYHLAQFFLVPVYPLFLLSRGLDLFEVGLVLAVYLTTVFVLEVPTGAIADRFGRKASFVAACGVRAIAFGLYAFAGGLADCLIAETIDALGSTLASGALEAWAVDGIRRDGDTRATDRMFARAQMITNGSMLVGGVISGYVAATGIERPWFVAAALFATTGVAGALVMREPPAATRGAHASVRANAHAALVAVRASAPLRLLCLLTAAGSFAMFPVWQYWQPRLVQLGGARLPVIGWVLALANVGALFGSAVLPRLLARFERGNVLCAANAWRAAFIAFAAGAGRFGPATAGITLQAIGSGVNDPVMTAWMNDHIASAQRATVLSIRSACFTFGGAAGLVVLGLVARGAGIPAAWALSATVLMVAAPGFLRLGRIARVPLGADVSDPPAKLGVVVAK